MKQKFHLMMRIQNWSIEGDLTSAHKQCHFAKLIDPMAYYHGQKKPNQAIQRVLNRS